MPFVLISVLTGYHSRATTCCLQQFTSLIIKRCVRGRGWGLNLDQTGMCHRHLKFITLFWSGKTQKGYPVLELPLLKSTVLYCIVLGTKTMFTLYLFNQMILPLPFSSVMFVQKSYKFSIAVISLSYDIRSAFQD